MKKKYIFLFLLLFIVACKKESKKIIVNNSLEKKNKEEPSKLSVIINAKVLVDDVFEVYFYEMGETEFHSEDFVYTKVKGNKKNQNIILRLPDKIYPERLRLDFGKVKTQKVINLNYVKLVYNAKEYVFNKNELINEFKHSKFINFNKDNMSIITKEINGSYDPYFYTKKLTSIIDYLIEED